VKQRIIICFNFILINEADQFNRDILTAMIFRIGTNPL